MVASTLLPVIEAADNFDVVKNRNNLALFCLSNDPASVVTPIGLLWPEVVEALKQDNEELESKGQHPVWDFISTESDSSSPRVTHAFFSSYIPPNASARSEAIAGTCSRWRDSGKFSDVIGGRMWRNELYPIYVNPFRCLNTDGIVCEMERAASSLFGIITYGVHLTVFQRPPPGKEGEVMTWVPTRSKTKQTWPGWLDNSVAGGIPSRMSPFEAIVKEAMEEASLTEDIVRKYTRSVGAVSYFFQKGRWLQPEVEFVYELEIPYKLSDQEADSFKPKPLDGEVEFFEFLPLSEVVERIHKGLFKPNCAVVLIDFLIRHGYVTPETDPNYLEIVTRIHSRFDYLHWC